MKYLFFIMLICAGCRGYWRPKPEKVESAKVDSALVVDTDSARLNFVVLNNEKYFFIGVRSDSTRLTRIENADVLDSLVSDAKAFKKNVIIYGEAKATYPDFKDLIEALKRRDLLRFQIQVDDKLNELRVEK